MSKKEDVKEQPEIGPFDSPGVKIQNHNSSRFFLNIETFLELQGVVSCEQNIDRSHAKQKPQASDKYSEYGFIQDRTQKAKTGVQSQR